MEYPIGMCPAINNGHFVCRRRWDLRITRGCNLCNPMKSRTNGRSPPTLSAKPAAENKNTAASTTAQHFIFSRGKTQKQENNSFICHNKRARTTCQYPASSIQHPQHQQHDIIIIGDDSGSSINTCCNIMLLMGGSMEGGWRQRRSSLSSSVLS